MNLFTWILNAKRSLTMEEAPIAVSNNSDIFDVELETPDIATRLDVCGGLITIDEEANSIQFVHYSVHEYLASNFSYSEADLLVTASLLNYSSNKTLAEWSVTVEEIKYIRPTSSFVTFLQPNLWEYGVEYLYHHLKQCNEVGTSSPFLRFLNSPTYQIFVALRPHLKWYGRYTIFTPYLKGSDSKDQLFPLNNSILNEAAFAAHCPIFKNFYPKVHMFTK